MKKIYSKIKEVIDIVICIIFLVSLAVLALTVICGVLSITCMLVLPHDIWLSINAYLHNASFDLFGYHFFLEEICMWLCVGSLGVVTIAFVIGFCKWLDNGY